MTESGDRRLHASDDVRLTGFTPTTYDLLASIVEEEFGHPTGSVSRPAVIPLPSAATLYFILRALPDKDFPGGKWATIQHLEALIDGSMTGIKHGHTLTEEDWHR